MSFKTQWLSTHSGQLYIHPLPLSIGCLQIFAAYYVEPNGQRKGMCSMCVRVVDHHHGPCLCVFVGDAPAV